jgi:hypothetical protein
MTIRITAECSVELLPNDDRRWMWHMKAHLFREISWQCAVILLTTAAHQTHHTGGRIRPTELRAIVARNLRRRRTMKTAKIILGLLAMSAASFAFSGCSTTDDSRESPPPNTRTPSTMPPDQPVMPERDRDSASPYPGGGPMP